MAGKKLPQDRTDFTDPFNAGQMVGMLVLLTFIENNKGISAATLEQLKRTAVENIEPYFERPGEDIYLMIDNILSEKHL